MKKYILPVILIFILGISLVYEAIKDTPTYDEPANMVASFAYVHKNDFRIYPDNPPFVKYLAGLMMFPIKSNINFPDNLETYTDPSKFDLYSFGRDFLYNSGNNTRLIIFLCRIIPIIFTLLLGILLFVFSQKIYGYRAGLLALFLYTFDPNIRGHGHILAFDIPLAFIILLICYLTYLLTITNKNNIRKIFFLIILISLSFSIAFMTKFTFVFFASVYILGSILILFGIIREPQLKKYSIHLLLSVLIIPIIFIWTFGLTTNYNKVTLDYNKLPIINSANKLLISNPAWNMINLIPMPYYYKAGIKTMFTHNFVSQPAYLFGEVRSQNNWFFYFPISFLLKVPLSIQLIIYISILLITKKILSGGKIIIKEYLFFISGIFFFLCMMIFSHINNVFRYLFPSYILFILNASSIANKKFNNNRLFSIFIFYICPLWLIFSSISSFPFDLSYTNELTGIPPQGNKYLSDSEIDWGQDLERLAEWLTVNGYGKETVKFSYLGTADPKYYGIKYTPLQFEDLSHLKGILAISVGNLTLGDWQYTSGDDYKLKLAHAPLDFLRAKKPDAVIGKSIFVYKF